MTEHVFDPATQKIVDAFDAQAKKRAAELLGPMQDPFKAPLREATFCLGYKAGVIDLGQVHRAEIAQLTALFEAACAWRVAARVPEALAGEVPDVAQDRLVAAIDAVRKVLP